MYILLKNNVVVQKQPNPQDGFVWTDKDVVCGQIEKDGVFSNPKPSKSDAQQKTNEESLSYLKDTDWYVVRMSETNVKVPDKILKGRASARAAIKEI
jgi:peptide deformylase